MVRIVKTEYGAYNIIVDEDCGDPLMDASFIMATYKLAWEHIVKTMYQFNSNACLVIDETKKRHVIYRLYEDGTKEKLPIKVRNSDAITVKNNN